VDFLTILAIGLIVYALANFIHEAIGHGGACLLLGGKPRVLSSMHFDGDKRGLSKAATRLIAAAGTIADLLAAALGLLALRREPKSAATHYFLWLFVAVNLFAGLGYFFFSGMTNIGDWAVVIAGSKHAVFWRILMAVLGWLAYLASVWWLMRKLSPIVGSQLPDRYRLANWLCLVPFFGGALLYVAAGALNPASKALLLISAVAGSLGGASGLAWGPQLLRGKPAAAPDQQPRPIPRSWPWIVSGAIVTAAFIAILGPGIRFKH
jgi:hypothetical protein